MTCVVSDWLEVERVWWREGGVVGGREGWDRGLFSD